MQSKVEVIGNKKNVLIVHNYYQIPGGEDTVVANEKCLLEEHGHKVVLYSRNNNEITRRNSFFVPIKMIFNLKTYYEIRHIIKNESIDIVHVHNTLNLISPSVYYAARVCKTPVVQTIHNFRMVCPGATLYRDGHICEECLEKGIARAIQYGCYRNSKVQTCICVLNTIFHRMTGIYKKINYICLTEFNKSKLLAMGSIQKDQIFIKPNFTTVTSKILNADQRKERIVFAGRLDGLKGIDILFEAWKKMGKKAPELVVCGVGPMEKWCIEFIDENEITNIKMLGFLQNSEVRDLIANSKALILPTQWYEGFPMSLIEAFSVGTPVVCSNLGNTANIVEEARNGYKFSEKSIEELMKAIEKLDDNPNIYNTTYEVFEKKYTAEKNYSELIHIYSECKCH